MPRRMRRTISGTGFKSSKRSHASSAASIPITRAADNVGGVKGSYIYPHHGVDGGTGHKYPPDAAIYYPNTHCDGEYDCHRIGRERGVSRTIEDELKGIAQIIERSLAVVGGVR